MRTVGRRSVNGRAWSDQGALARTAALLRGTRWLVPRGVYRFESFGEADAWMTQTIARTHARLSRRTSSGSAARFTKDIDLLVDDAPENIAAVKRGLAILPDNAAAEIRDTDVREHVVVRVADEIVIDLMGRACGLSYADAAGDAETILLEGVEVPVASKRTLIRTKDTVRASDRADRDFLQRRLDEESR